MTLAIEPHSSIPPRPKLLKAHDLAEWLDVSEWRVYDLVRQGVLPHIRMGRNVRFRTEAIENWLASGGAGLGEK